MSRQLLAIRHLINRIASRLPILGLATLAVVGPASAQPRIVLVPQPKSMERTAGQFAITAKTTIVVESSVKSTRAVGEYLAQCLKDGAGLAVPVKDGDGSDRTGAIVLETVASETLGSEGYELSVTPVSVLLRASKPAGLFYGVQTIRQLLDGHALPGVHISDQPRFAWRGLLLDEGRHFFGKAFVKHTIDRLAYHKLNTLHWHLTDDQGWRIEIKKYPKLTEVGAWRDQTEGDGQRYGGFYTQDDIRDIVAYAAARYVTIVPEIEMPGHSLAALASYPEFSCTGGPFKVRTEWGVEPNVYCAGNEAMFVFLQNVLDEVFTLFPSPYIHVGGDECPKTSWHACPKCQARMKAEGLKNEAELQSYFTRRMEGYLHSKGRRLIGWDEILEGGLPPRAAVMSWRGMEGALQAARSDHDYVASPATHCYLDFPASSTPLQKVYAFDPIPAGLTPEQRQHCLGVQGNMWTEHTPTAVVVDRMIWPRLCALAEVAWSPGDRRDAADFAARIQFHARRLAAPGLNIQIEPLAQEKTTP